jgi:methanogen extracellular protein (TIGR04279 family)
MLMLLLAFTSTAVGSPTGDEYFVNIAIDGNENVTFADHTSSSTDGNWIVLKGGTPVKLPSPLTFGYHGINSTSYVSNGKTINITANVENNTDHIIEYPYGKHPMLTNVSGKNDLDIEFYGSPDFANMGVDVYLVRTSPSSLKNAFDAAAKGDTSSFRNLLSSSYEISLNKSLNNSGDMNMSFGGVDAGDYVMFVLLNTSYLTGANDLSILSATTFQVLEYDSVMSAPAMVKSDSNVEVSMSLMNASDASYTYGALLIHKNAYRAAVRLEFNGTKAGTNLMINDADLIKGYKIAGVGLSNVNKTIATDLINDTIGANNGAVTVKTTGKNSTSILLVTDGLKNGNYVLIVGVYKSGENLVAFGQSDVTISSGTPHKKSSSSGGRYFQATVVQNESIEEDVGEVEEDVPNTKKLMSVANRPTGDAGPDVEPTTEFKTTEPGYKRLLQSFIEFVSFVSEKFAGLRDIIIDLVW